MIKEQLEDWVFDHRLKIEWVEDDVFEIKGVGKFYLFDSGEDNVFDKNMSLAIKETDGDELLDDGIEYIAYKFGRCFYYTSCESDPAEMNILKYLGSPDYEIHEDYINLGVRGKHDLLNGSTDYPLWVKKAKFFGMDAIGICERNTLAGTLPLQTACGKSGIKPIFGMTFDVLHNGVRHEAKVYSLTQKGWQGLLRISKAVNVDNWTDKHIDFNELSKWGEGNVFVFGKRWIPEKKTVDLMEIHFDKVFYQFDTAEYLSDKIDAAHLQSSKDYLDKYGANWELEPILISDTFYMDADDYEVKKYLNKIDIGASHNQSKDQYFKHFEDHYDKLETLFEDLDWMEDLICTGAENTRWLADQAEVKIDTSRLNLPNYEMTDEEKKKYKTNLELFHDIIDEGFERLVPPGKEQEYEERLDKEEEVIRVKGAAGVGNETGFVDYFLILWDIIQFCKRANIYVGTGRGSAAGSLISYLMGITTLDPIKYGLIFERFLNEKRVSSGLPDIDVDFESLRRQEVKDYMKDRYGYDHVFSIGTYGSLKIKAAMKDLARVKGVDTMRMNILSKTISDKEAAKMDMPGFFLKCQQNKKLKQFVSDYPEIVEAMRVVLGQPKSQSIHAAATVITPKEMDGKPMEAYDWLPLKVHDGVLVSEWEGGTIESAGFLKEDILAIDALDKIHYTVNLIKEHTGEEVNWQDIPLDDPDAFKMFSDGYTQGLFQFNGEGMTKYIMDMQPTSIDDLTAANALYRPATMDIDAHNDYVKLKRGEKEPEYDWGLEEVTKPTYGIMVYQEQMMEATRVIAGFSLVEADGVRKAMGKKIKELMDSYKDKFIEGAIKNGCDEFVALQIWNKIEKGSGYGFNKSHAACYAVIAYTNAYLKAHYLPYVYTSELQFAKDDKKMAPIISEINEIEGMSIVPPDINNSFEKFTTDFDKGVVYWSLQSIKFVGNKAVVEIIDDRDKNGAYKSFKDFVDRMKTYSVNKRQIVNMILSGCFDEIESIQQISDRYIILKSYYDLLKEAINEDEYPLEQRKKNFFWSRKQIELSGLGTINFKNVFDGSKSSEKYKSMSLLDPATIGDEKKLDKLYWVCATIAEIREFPTKRGNMGKITLQSNDVIMRLTVWPDIWESERDKVINATSRILAVNCKVVYDDYTGENGLMSYSNTSMEII